MSGSSVSSSWSARMPSTDTMVSKPRTARLDRIRSTMLGSSSTTRAQVLRVSSVIFRWSSFAPGFDGQVDAEAGALARRGQLDPAAVSLHDAPCDGQAEPGAGALAVAPPVASVASVVRVASVAAVAHARAPDGLKRRGRQ